MHTQNNKLHYLALGSIEDDPNTWFWSSRCTGCLRTAFLPIRFWHISFLFGDTRVSVVQKSNTRSLMSSVMHVVRWIFCWHALTGKEVFSSSKRSRAFAKMMFLLCIPNDLASALPITGLASNSSLEWMQAITVALLTSNSVAECGTFTSDKLYQMFESTALYTQWSEFCKLLNTGC